MLLKDYGPIPDNLEQRIRHERDSVVLDGWVKLAAKVSTIEEFSSQL